MKKSPAKKSGFTLIEIVIVLAIAALIMVIVFVAVSGAQRSRRDTEKRSVAAAVLASLTQCASDNKGKIGTSTTSLCTSYISKAGGPATGYLGATTTAPTAADKPFAATIGNASGAACSATVVASVETTSGGTVCVYYFSENSNSVVFLSGTI